MFNLLRDLSAILIANTDTLDLPPASHFISTKSTKSVPGTHLDARSSNELLL